MKRYILAIVAMVFMSVGISHAVTTKDRFNFEGPVTISGALTTSGAVTQSGDQTFSGAVTVSNTFTSTSSIVTSGPIRNTGATVVDKVTSDPCGTTGYEEGAIFYNDTANYMCFCDGTNAVNFKNYSVVCF
jgi:hypothetical protein